MIRLLLLLLSLALLSSCGSDVAGATSETTNGPVKAVLPGGGSAEGAQVYVRRTGKQLRLGEQPQQASGKVNSDGVYLGDTTIALGSYTMEINHPDGYGAWEFLDTANGSVIYPDTVQLLPHGKLIGDVDFTKERQTSSSLSVQLLGLDRIITLDSGSHFEFTDLPQGEVRLIILENETEEKLFSGDTYDVYAGEETNTGVYHLGSALDLELKVVRQFLELNGLSDTLLHDIIEIDTSKGSIRSIYANNLGIDTLPPALFELRLKHLSLAWNSLKTIPVEVGNLVDLYYIDLTGNELRTLPEELADLRNVSEIDLENNLLSDLPESFLAENKLPNLREFHIRYNNLSSLSIEKQSWIDIYSWHSDWRNTQRVQ